VKNNVPVGEPELERRGACENVGQYAQFDDWRLWYCDVVVVEIGIREDDLEEDLVLELIRESSEGHGFGVNLRLVGLVGCRY
jgi:hypothetical protein